jgi:radical SAM superfamily enzyme YgiQ (UPF0313 family)
VKVVLLSTYEMGRQPFGLASPAAWLRQDGAEVVCADLSRDRLPEDAVRAADLVAFYVPMHTATRMAAKAVEKVKQLNPAAHLCFYGLYAPMNEDYLRRLGGQTILGGEFEAGLLELVRTPHSAFRTPQLISLDRLDFRVPDRTGLPELERYAHLHLGTRGHRVCGYTEASRGCKHLCRHCPVVPVYQGAFRIVPRDVVLEDVRRQVAAGAEHITFGDPDFFNGPAHALGIVELLHREWPDLSYDVTIKVEHLLQQQRHLPALRDTGCVLVTTAVESLDDRVLNLLEKGHTRSDFEEVVRLFQSLPLALNPTFVPFHPWTTPAGYQDLLRALAELGLSESVSPVQLAIRLLIPSGSRLLELEEVRGMVGPFDQNALCYPWRHADPEVERLCAEVQSIVARGAAKEWPRAEVMTEISEAAGLDTLPVVPGRIEVPYLNEPWYC